MSAAARIETTAPSIPSPERDRVSVEILEPDVVIAAWRRLRDRLVRHKQTLGVAFALLVLAVVAGAVYRMGQSVRPEAVYAALAAVPASAIGLAGLFTALSFAALICYDLSGLSYVGRRLPLPKIVFTAFCAYAVGNVTGIGALSGGAIRLRYYGRAGVPADEIAKVVAFVALAFGLGVVVLTAVALLLVPESLLVVLHGPTSWVKFGAGTLLLALGAALALGPRHLPRVLAMAWPTRGIVLWQLLVTAADLAASAAVLYVLLPSGTASFPVVLAVFVVATGAGVVSHVPAGLGVFETVMVAALGPAIDLPAVLGALLLYRVIYQAVPLGLALALVGGTEAAGYARDHRLIRLFDARGGLRAGLAAVTAIGLGIVMALSGPGADPTGLPAGVESSLRVLPAVLGCALILAARGLVQRMDGAWLVGMACAGLGLGLSLVLDGLTPAIALPVLLLGTLTASRSKFTQPTVLGGLGAGRGGRPAVLVLALGVAVVIAVGARGEPANGVVWWISWMSADAPDGPQAALSLAAVAAACALLVLLRPRAVAVPAPTADALQSALKIVEAQGSAPANLVRMGDKSVLFSADGRAFLMYAKRGRSWIALFDPVGPKDAWPGLITRFIEGARGAGCRPVFYQVSHDLLPHTVDAGLRAFKLGEQAMVDLPRFDLRGGKWANLRRSINRAARDGLSFAVVEPAAIPLLVEELRTVSDAWLAHHSTREKGFSIGAFDPAYVEAHPLAVLRLDGRIVAFATLLATPTRHDAFIDLMRHVPGVHRGGMDLLFVEIIEHLKRDGFQVLNLGMAPLAGLSDRSCAPLWTKIARAVFECGEHFYNFKGLLAFKSKFDPEWQPRYLVVAGGINPYLAVMDVALLIGGGFRGVFRK